MGLWSLLVHQVCQPVGAEHQNLVWGVMFRRYSYSRVMGLSTGSGYGYFHLARPAHLSARRITALKPVIIDLMLGYGPQPSTSTCQVMELMTVSCQVMGLLILLVNSVCQPVGAQH